tara:strand:- start:99 stop:371 length:273 start_codon:yes stop_codon:yes gene_type:complete
MIKQEEYAGFGMNRHKISVSKAFESDDVFRCKTCRIVKRREDFRKHPSNNLLVEDEKCTRCKHEQKAKIDYVNTPHSISRPTINDDFFGY